MINRPKGQSYVFKTGKFKGRSIAQLYLTRFPELERFIEDFARDKPNLREAVEWFDYLKSRLEGRKLVAGHCASSDCSKPGLSMSLWGGSPRPYFWCEDHKPWEKVDKEPISIEASAHFYRKGDQRWFLEELRFALGIERVTKQVAEDFFHSGWIHAPT